MKKIYRCLVLFVFIVLFSTVVNAGDAYPLSLNKTYKIDLNGGSKEKVKLKQNYNKKTHKNRWTLYINNKKIKSRTYIDTCCVTNFYYLDTNTADKYHELLIIAKGTNDIFDEVWMVRFYNTKKKKVIPLTLGSFPGCPTRFDFVSCDQNQLTFFGDTPFYNPCFGLYYCILHIGLNANSMQFIPEETYNFRIPNYGPSNVLIGQSDYYELARSMVLYSDVSCSNKIKTLYSGTKFTASSFKPVSIVPKITNGKYLPYSPSCDLYVKITTQTGDTGWIHFPNEENGKYLTYVPGWG